MPRVRASDVVSVFESARLALIVGGLLLAFPAWGQEHKLVPVQRPIAPFLQPDPRQGYLRQPNAEDLRVPRANVKRAGFTRLSLMPEGLLEGLKPGDVSDLFVYLLTLR